MTDLFEQTLPDGDLLHCDPAVLRDLWAPVWCATCGYLIGSADIDDVRWIWTWCAAETLRQLHWHLCRMPDPPDWDEVVRFCGTLWRATGMKDTPEELVAEATAYLDSM